MNQKAEGVSGRRLIVTLATFSGVSALGGASELALWPTGNQFVPLTLIEHTPFRTFWIPALLLGIVVGGSCLVSAVLVWRRSRAAVDATICAGGALTVWIIAEMAMMRQFHWLHALYGSLGVAILALGARAAFRSKSTRLRWVLLVTGAEALGFLVPACTGIATAKAGMGGPAEVALLSAAGMIEGFALGAGQAWALPLPVRKLRYALWTALGAGLAWSSVLSFMSLAPSLPLPVVPVFGLMTATIGLLALGVAQWVELRRYAPAAQRWIFWTALAWSLALPFSFTPAPFVDESTPTAAQVVLFGCGGLLMAFVMAQMTWQGVRRLLAESPAQPALTLELSSN